MGKPYSNELDELPRTYSWCLRAEVGALAECLDQNRGHPLLAVGSAVLAIIALHCDQPLTSSHVWVPQQVPTPLVRALAGRLTPALTIYYCVDDLPASSELAR